MGSRPLRALISGTEIRRASPCTDISAYPLLLHIIRGIARAVGGIEADRIGKPQCCRTEIVVSIRKVNPVDQVESAPIVENVRRQPAAGWTLHTGDLLEPGDRSLDLSWLPTGATSAAGHRQKAAEDRGTARLDARDRLAVQISEQCEIVFSFT